MGVGVGVEISEGLGLASKIGDGLGEGFTIGLGDGEGTGAMITGEGEGFDAVNDEVELPPHSTMLLYEQEEPVQPSLQMTEPLDCAPALQFTPP